MCPFCKSKGEIVNGVDLIIQSPSLLKRLGLEEHSYIRICNNCLIGFEEDTQTRLTPQELIEIRDNYEQALKELEGHWLQMIG